jgi:hypothetical protein
MRTEIRNFEISPNEYEIFRFTISQPKILLLRMIATAPVNLLLLDSYQRKEYEQGQGETHRYTAAWGRRSDLDEKIEVGSGTWYLVVEGSTESSKGKIEVLS